MKYRTIGGSDTRVSTIALGGNIFGYACDAAQTREIIAAAEALGVNFADTADVYSEGRSEEFIGQALRGRRNRWIVATKVGVDSDATGRGSGAKAVIHSRIEHSLRRLQTDYMDIYQLHHFDPDTPVEETLAAAEVLRAQGKVRHFGISNCTAPQVRAYTSASRTFGLPMPATHQVHYNILKRQIEHDLVPQSEPTRPRLLAYGVLGRGVLSGKYRSGEAVPANTRAAMSARAIRLAAGGAARCRGSGNARSRCRPYSEPTGARLRAEDCGRRHCGRSFARAVRRSRKGGRSGAGPGVLGTG